MVAWPTVPIGELFRLKQGTYLKPEEMKEEQTAAFPFPVYGANGVIGYSNRKMYSERTTLVSCRGANCGVVHFTVPNIWISNNSIACVPTAEVDPTFYYYVCRNTNFGDVITGSAQPQITITNLSSKQFIKPPLPVQRRIADILAAYDELIEKSQRRIRILEKMARSLYSEWFVQFRFPGHEKVKMEGGIPKGWEVRPLESLLADHIGGGWGKETSDETHTEPAWVIRGTDIPDARSSGVAKVPHRFHANSNIRTRRLQAGDILFEVSGGSKGQPVGRTLLVTPQLLSAFGGEDVICASFCKRVRPDADGYSSELLYLSFLEGYESGEIEQFQVQSTGISNFKWTEYIAKVERVIPPAPIRVLFRERVTPLFSQIATLGLQIQNLRRTRDLLLPRLLSGQINLEEN